MLPITSMVATLAAVSLIALSLPVSLRRMKVGTEIGMGDDLALLRRIRAQGNFIEYVPLGLILLALAEYRQAATGLVWTIAGLLVAGRLLHATGMLSGLTPARATGMLATYGALLAGAVALVI
ncbi:MULTISPECIES: MAPEG family protein [unclassified Sphingobium]|uniref:MAPEG family protein n=1 Tax=unclassified Sphingobium TaxID=2611147 RepID=UPI000D152A5F|nr:MULTISPECIES: MAPEG family protein [unclassified Sphingobium]MBG6118654.1 putative membrane protein YecN with MAPEG domain [Sphingobium sp. JAI105]PSO13663.1 hypothetical protein C7E20_01165 [Sphingobium sp. AEW4]TWD10665.1 hypothetical protein FB595_103232 [Sphingobium sp. AEW010]TWD27930.1 hypothetical protein FB596_10383 [Sphingobium sp. AEW013]TWD28999.1 hypothetical protein FB594_103232 [Sphingobium sp. AEW001]